MRCTLSGYFTEIYLYLCVICYETSYSNISAYATSLNSSEEIKSIFSLPEATASVLKGAPKIGNFAEGGPITENLTKSSIKTSIKNLFKNSDSLKNTSAFTNSTERQNISSLCSILMQNKSHNFLGHSSDKVLPTKLTETESNLFLGMTEVIHSNGTVSAKPHKGVHYNKIVPRKGVDNGNEKNGFSGYQSCLWLSEYECYSTMEIKDVECFCCKEGNTLGKKIKQQASVNCKNCKSDNILPSESKQICKNICCNSIVHDIYSVTSTQDVNNNYLNYSTLPSAEKKQHNSLASQKSGAVSESNFSKKTITEGNNSFNSLKKNSKLKPSITKVPYDVEVVTEILSKDQQKVFVPIIVSLFLLLLIGILMFFLWRRIKEYWDKRYYKRTDFLIDGMYND